MITSLWDVLGNHLVAELLFKGAVVVAVAALVAFLARNRSAATRHAMWTAGLGVLIFLPVALVSVPDWQIPVLTPGRSPAARSLTEPAATGAMTGPENSAGQFNRGDASSLEEVVGRDGMNGPAEGPAEPSLLRRVRLAVLIIYGAGVLFFLFVSVRAVFRMAMITRYGATPAEGRETAWAEECVRALGMWRRPKVLVTHWTNVPITLGVFRPVILLPPSLEFWSEERTRAAVLHELAHVRRFDYVWQLIADLAVAIHWPNPWAWLARRAMRREGERASDDAVLLGGMTPADYAQHLVDIARTAVPGATGVPSQFGRGEFGSRINDILNAAVNRAPLSRLPAVAAGLAVVTLGTGIAGASFAAPPRELRSAADIWALTESRSPQAVETLIAQLRNAAPGHRPVAALSLGEFGNPEALRPLVAALEDDDPHVRENAALALGKLGGAELASHVLPLTADPVTDVRSVAAWVLGEIGGPSAAAALFGVLRDEPDDHTRTMAAMAVTRVSGVDVVPELVSLLNEVKGPTRLDIVIALGLTGDGRVVSVLSDIITSDPDPVARRVAVRSLGQVDDARRVSVWIAAMRDPDWQVRNQALVLLADQEDARSRSAVLSALDDPKHQVRLNAAWALEGVGR